MTVKKLIAELQKMPPNCQVGVSYHDNNAFECKHVGKAVSGKIEYI